jgi:hypothetical protein
MARDPADVNTTTRTADLFKVGTWNEPDGRVTWCIRRFTVSPGHYGRHVVSWHETREEAEAALALLKVPA